MTNDDIINIPQGWIAFDIQTFEDKLTAERNKEREACAELCDDMVLYTGFDCAAKIRARA